MGRTSNTPEKLQAALCDLMWQQSYGSVTIDAICERAGVKKGSFYHAYPDKAALSLDAFEYFWETHSRPWLAAAFSPTEPPLVRIATWLATGIQKSKECQRIHGKLHGCPLFNVGSEISTLEPAVAEKVTEILRRSRSFLTSTLRDAIAEDNLDLDDPEEISRDVFTLVQGAITQGRITNKLAPIERLPISVARLLGTTLPSAQPLTV
ncbi:MAG: TetR/AcrR family transcriptional regulator [Akkermansiaceae bacterium]|nr:TetR/AcrR family transcriptional regulator [Akkermansiaceae bacterium]